MIAQAFREGSALLRRRAGVSFVLALSLAVPLSLAGFTASLGLWSGPLTTLESEKVVVRVLLHPRMDEAQRKQWLEDQRRTHPDWILSEVPKEILAERLRIWFPYLEDLLKGENAVELPPLVEVQAPRPEEVDALSDGPAVIAVGPKSSVHRALGRGAKTLVGLATMLSVVLLASAFILAATWIHLEVYRHAEEISIMRLVGVTESAIRSPFVVAAAVPGIGAGVASVLGTLYLVSSVEDVAIRFGLHPQWFRPGSSPLKSPRDSFCRSLPRL